MIRRVVVLHTDGAGDAPARRACDAERMAQEQGFRKTMESVTSFSIDEGGVLRLRGADGSPLLRLVRANP